ncbi:2-dehydro-3-deoxygalactonokinase [Nioella aestuarii]|uniref:2-dehydro-3-deoxygalactonokinase n=1 Tax=Nioella aestuarii TaxID=1662864 RepID=UPI003D7F3523
MSENNAAPHWIAVDWSEYGMQAWAMDQHGSVLMKVRSAQGLAQVAIDAFEAVLLKLVRPWLIRDQTPVVVGGLSGVQKLASIPAYSPPFRPEEASPWLLETEESRLMLHAVPGLEQSVGKGALLTHDSLIRGVVTEMPSYSGALCIPDERTQWVGVQQGEVSCLMPFMTAELAELLAPKADRGSLPVPGPAVHEATFRAAVSNAMDTPELTPRHLLEARFDSDPAKSRLKGLLIGMELASAQSYWRRGLVMVVNGSQWSTLYALALSGHGVGIEFCDRDTMTLAGLKHAYRSLCETFA